MNLKELRLQAKEQGLKGYSKMKKADLMEALQTNRDLHGPTPSENKNDVREDNVIPPPLTSPLTPTAKPTGNYSNMTNKALKNIAKERGFKNYSKLNKKGLVELLSS